MNLAMEKRYKKEQVKGAIELLKSRGSSDNEIVSEVVDTFNVTGDFVRELLALQKA